jgi:hypothetical protein
MTRNATGSRVRHREEIEDLLVLRPAVADVAVVGDTRIGGTASR